MDLTNLDTPDNTSAKVPGEFKHQFGGKPIEEFITLSLETYSFKCCGKRRAKEKGIKIFNNAKHEDYYNNM